MELLPQDLSPLLCNSILCVKSPQAIHTVNLPASQAETSLGFTSSTVANNFGSTPLINNSIRVRHAANHADIEAERKRSWPVEHET